MRSVKVTLPENSKFFKENLKEKARLSEIELEKALVFLKKHDEIQTEMMNEFIAHLYSLIPIGKKYDEHRKFLNKEYKTEGGKNNITHKLLEIFVSSECHPFKISNHKGFYYGKETNFDLCIYEGGSIKNCESIIKILEEINDLFKDNAVFIYFNSVHLGLKISFNLL